MFAFAALLLAAAPAAPALPPLPAPLGRIGSVIEAPNEKGYPAHERVVVTKLPGCEREQALHLTRMVSGTLYAVEKLQGWFDAQKGLEQSFFGSRSALGALSKRVAASVPSEKKKNDGLGEHLWVLKEKPAAKVTVLAAAEDRQDRCLPVIKVQLLDDKGVEKLRYDADFGGVLGVQLFGARCQSLTFVFDGAAEAFQPTLTKTKGCKG